jgi:tetratricopeptide (TPR) repeat protein
MAPLRSDFAARHKFRNCDRVQPNVNAQARFAVMCYKLAMAKRDRGANRTSQKMRPVPLKKGRFQDHSWMLALILLAVTCIAYIPAIRGGFVWDDAELITHNPLIKDGNGLQKFWFTTESLDYYPLTSTLFWLEWRLWRGNPMGFHVVNIILHAANAILVWLILRRLGIPGAWLAALVFAIHPVNAATVAWISEHKNTLSMLFFATAILLYLKFDAERRWGWYVLALGAFLLALLAKTAVVMLPVVLLGCVWWLHKRVQWKDFLRVLPFFGMSFVMGLVTVWFQFHHAMGGYTHRGEGLLSRLAAAGWVPWFYLSKTLWPFHLSVIYPRWNIDPTTWLSYVPGLILAGCLALFWWKRESWGRPLLFAAGYFVVMLFPVAGFLDQAFFDVSLVADHFQYFAIVGVIAVLTATGTVICLRMNQWRRGVGLSLTLALLMTLGIVTWSRSAIYAENRTLWEDTLIKNPDAWLAHHNLGAELAKAGELHQAIEQYEETLRINPDYPQAHSNLGIVLTQLGRAEDALAHYRQALRLRPDYVDAHVNMGTALAGTGKVEEAMGEFAEALRINPGSFQAHNDLGLALLSLGRMPEAIRHFEQASRINPDYVDAHLNWGAALGREGKLQEAMEQFAEALEIKPDSVEAHNNLGLALLQLGRSGEAIDQFQQALRIKPDYPEAQRNLQRAQAAR